MKWNPKDPHGPFDKGGNLQHYPLETGYGADRVGPEWRRVLPWTGDLRLEDYARGRSAAYFEFADEFGRKYPMMLADFVELVKTHRLDRGAVFGRWALAKRGQNYGIRPAREGE